MVFARNALSSGQGKAWNSITFTPTCRKVKEGKLVIVLDIQPTA